jgi:hypothetical protein
MSRRTRLKKATRHNQYYWKNGTGDVRESLQVDIADLLPSRGEQRGRAMTEISARWFKSLSPAAQELLQTQMQERFGRRANVGRDPAQTNARAA